MSGKLPKDQLFSFSLRDLLIFCAIYCSAVALCILLRMADSAEGFAFPVFVLAVLLISRFTNGYLFGTLAALLSVVGINYIFTYPYLAFDFTLSGYPLTFLTMLGVSLVTCTMTTKIKQQDRLRAETEKEKMRAGLLRSVSHDIRTPLTSIVGATSTVLETPDLPRAEQRALLEDARDEAQWLIRVVENLLSITRMGDDNARLVKQPEAAEEVLGAAAHKFHKRFPAVQVTVSVPDELLLVPMDAILIEQVLSNLLENAAIHGETTTQIRLSAAPDGDYAQFIVQDNGRGIPARELPHLFDGTRSHTAPPSGDGKRDLGLGLSVCMAIVQAHGGTIQAKNLADGARFTFRLPLSEKELQ
ncbi:MAG: DUF4118 domain-containing protein [Eubacteriales bacterium]|nr:DUF4118 domain-containing protein [Eubacteriales bacterium]